MKITVSVNQLTEILDITNRFVSRNATLPILQNLYIKGNIDSMIIRATDMEKYVEIQLPAQVQGEWALTVDAKTLSDITRTIDDEQIELLFDQEKDTITIQSTKDTFTINGISASEYVALPDVQPTQEITLPAEQFSQWITKVEYAVTEKNFSPIFTGILIKVDQDGSESTLTFVGTDSFRLAEYKIPFTGNADGNSSIIIPKTNINDIKRVADFALEKESEEDMTVKFSDNLVACEIQIGDIHILCTSLLIQGTFPDYNNENIMPTAFNTKVIVNKAQCDKAIKKIEILTRDINNFISCVIGPDSLTVESGKTDRWDASTSLSAMVEWSETTLWLNGKYINDFVKASQSDEMVFNIVDSGKPIVLTDPNDANYRYVVRPLQK